MPPPDCAHGTFDKTTLSCVCEPGWKHAGPTDVVHFLTGACTQFACESSKQCQERLGIPGANCDIPGWDCYCGWSGAFGGPASFGLGSGYQTWGKNGAACQGPIYTLSFWMAGITWMAMKYCYLVVLSLAVVMSPFGQTHVRCQCYDPSMFRLIGRVAPLLFPGGRPDCDGTCTMPAGSGWSNYYDFAWSIYVIDVGIWVYCFLVVAWLTFIVSWGLLLWMMVLVVGITALVFAACSGEGGGGGGDGCGCDNGHGDGCGGCTDCVTCDSCTSDGCTPLGGPGDFTGDYVYFVGGPSPDANYCSCNCCTLCSKCAVCLPLAMLFREFPRMPANMWGGFVGRHILWTHPSSTRVYSGGNWLIDRMGFRGSVDLHNRTDWRDQVSNFLYPQATTPRPQSMTPRPPPEIRQETSTTSVGQRLRSGFTRANFPDATVKEVKGRRIGKVTERFDRERDNCRNSSFDDYLANECWICCDSKEQETWDLWLQCGHLFCSRCSEKMLERRMPCPLCRKVSFNVKRGPPAYCPQVVPEANEAAEATDAAALQAAGPQRSPPGATDANSE